MSLDPNPNSATSQLEQYHAKEIADALEEAMEVLVGCVIPAGGCDDAATLASTIERGEAALACIGRLRVRSP